MAIPRIQSYRFDAAKMLPDNRVQWQVDAGRAVLLIHDMQNYFLDFYDRQQAPIDELLVNIRRLKAACESRGIPVVYTAQPGNQHARDRALLTDFWGPGLAADEYLQAIDESIAPSAGDQVYTKWRYSALQRTDLATFMAQQGRDQLLVCGVYAHIGILATSLEAFMRDIQAFVIADAVADFSAEDHAMALGYIAGRCGRVDRVDDLIELLAGAADAPALNRQVFRQQVAESLGVTQQEIGDDDNLMHLGLDSIRLMTLIETWRDMGAEIQFAELAEVASIGQWWDIIEQSLRDTRPALFERQSHAEFIDD